MVIQTNEKEFKGKTLQEYLNWKYPAKEDKESVERIDISEILGKIGEILEKRDKRKVEAELDLREFKNSKEIKIAPSGCFIFFLTKLNVSGLTELTKLTCVGCYLTSVGFLNQLPNPEKLKELLIFGNNIQPTDISFFSKFVNLRVLSIGNAGSNREKYNRFYGSLKSYRNLTKLEEICIEATDVSEGLEYLPSSLVKSIKKEEEKYDCIECSPHDTNAKCKVIQDQLRPFNYDLEAWQLAHPEKMLIAKPELFTSPDSKEKWLTALSNKILQVREEIITAKTNETDKIKKISRLESKISELEQAKQTISQQTQTEFSTQNKSTQTDLSGSDYEQQQKENQELKEQIKKLEEENNKTWYQKIIEKYSKK